MKVILILAIVLTLFAILAPCFIVDIPAADLPEADKETDNYVDEEQHVSAPVFHEPEIECKVRVLMGQDEVVMDIEEYLIGVVAGEMPVSFEEEALKAQAVAARTYTLYKMQVEPSQNHESDVCNDPGCCKAYLGETELKEKWGEDYETNFAKIEMAVWETQGMYMVYDGEPVLAVFHSSSSGATENSGNVWNRDVPYLVSVESPEDSEDVTNYITTTEIKYDEFESLFISEYPEAVFDEDHENWVSDIEYSESGRITSLVIGGVQIQGTELRKLYELRSTAVSVAMGANGVVFTVTGYGHGVGMSQYGANCLAKEGKTWREILLWYYSGVEFAGMLNSI